MQAPRIRVLGARVHNLKNISIDIPRDKLVVITGVSGSGKSSLAFDTLYAEGQRRYVESLSAYARQFLGIMERPDVDAIEGLSPAISIEQKTTSRNPRSTVGTITEVYDYLRLLFARVGKPHCHQCGEVITSQPASHIIDQLSHLSENSKLQLLAPIARNKKGEFKKELAQASKDGFVRVRINGEILAIEDAPELKKTLKHNIELVVDRLVIRDGIRTRLADSVETALRYGEGMLIALVGSDEELLFSENCACAACGISYPEIEPRLFSFNSPAGACSTCDGIGRQTIFDPALVVPNPKLSLDDGAIAPWGGRETFMYRQTIESVIRAVGGDMKLPFEKLSTETQKALLYGTGRLKIDFTFETATQARTVSRPFEGVIPNLERRYRETSSEDVREELSQYINAIDCPACEGSRLNITARHVLLGDLSLPTICKLPLREAQDWINNLSLSQQDQDIANKVLEEISARLGFMIEVGLDYLSLNRTSGTLSGGEAQRIRLATQIGSALVGVLYILDEPSIGLHQRDNDRLLGTLRRLRDLGNSVIVVEHDEDAIRTADFVIDMGPHAGEHGGEIVASGTLNDILKAKTLTSDYLSGRKAIKIPKRKPVSKDHPMLGIEGATEHNLKSVKAEFPIGVFTCVTGVSGSGKSTLTIDTLYRAFAQAKGLKTERIGRHTALIGEHQLDKIIDIDQSPIGRTPRSNPATYTGLFTPIRELFAAVPESRARGYKPGRFSFNVKGGRCEACEGDGLIKVEMHFLPDVYVQCETCQGKRYNRETLDVRYKGKTIDEVLNMTVEEGATFFDSVPSLKNKLLTLEQVGLGYIRLGQAATTLSGGEAQRVKLAKELARKATGDTLYILDEPTTGLHFADVDKLLDVLHALVDRGNTVIVIEHNLDVIKTADWIIDMGPEGGDKGGEVVIAGTPETVAKCKASWTGRYLQSHLK
ncbi:MAG: excinuclease ABC subunit A [Zetaproteobacteria bacterium CG2_30_46_52]|nr:MAG: excinuclease ABC subunit A [Zetaproteobacteria bacterium CG2_30_46_52]